MRPEKACYVALCETARGKFLKIGKKEALPNVVDEPRRL